MVVSKIIGNSHHSEDVQNIYRDQSYMKRRRKDDLEIALHV